ncbi:DMT family transporter [Salinicola rhizosphaerae]|uniref:Multidrug DMT transporter permease n=1 Tax=Salinicola rhizosphaerae TaxID=1443141 RepID=A0ABQ3EE46_9GAMM|nr:DMT family transporter [Salinicola rhizosphaerae]GHB31932.1 multidrug DMT transporter permease [Salinicola rhizosphaerae]
MPGKATTLDDSPLAPASRGVRLASMGILLAGGLWGFYWLPVRELEQHHLGGVFGSLIIAVTACLLLLPWAWHYRHRLRRASAKGLVSVALGGAAFMLYSIALVYGQVAVVILLFYLTPVWSTLIERFWWRWPLTGRRMAVIALGLGGLGLVMSGNGSPLPQGPGDWLGLASGALWAIASSGMREHNTLGPGEGSFLFAIGAVIAALLLMPALSPELIVPDLLVKRLSIIDAPWTAAGWALAAAGVWWAASLAIVVWAAGHLAPARLGILMMSEVLVGVFSAALFAGEPLAMIQIIGAALVITAAVMEVIPTPRTATG